MFTLLKQSPFVIRFLHTASTSHFFQLTLNRLTMLNGYVVLLQPILSQLYHLFAPIELMSPRQHSQMEVSSLCDV